MKKIDLIQLPNSRLAASLYFSYRGELLSIRLELPLRLWLQPHPETPNYFENLFMNEKGEEAPLHQKISMSSWQPSAPFGKLSELLSSRYAHPELPALHWPTSDSHEYTVFRLSKEIDERRFVGDKAFGELERLFVKDGIHIGGSEQIKLTPVPLWLHQSHEPALAFRKSDNCQAVLSFLR